ncbi:MAG: hypothetical protein NZ608_04670, partial [candidate division WOR-3 bacterium]|nr:hypothetical protein [candidate division WOR-3 bacterium]
QFFLIFKERLFILLFFGDVLGKHLFFINWLDSFLFFGYLLFKNFCLFLRGFHFDILIFLFVNFYSF